MLCTLPPVCDMPLLVVVGVAAADVKLDRVACLVRFVVSGSLDVGAFAYVQFVVLLPCRRGTWGWPGWQGWCSLSCGGASTLPLVCCVEMVPVVGLAAEDVRLE